jgi:HPt (histidine-containing phosphotransfer) domain-containing protein
MHEPTIDHEALAKLLKYIPREMSVDFAHHMFETFRDDAMIRISRLLAEAQRPEGPSPDAVRRDAHALKGGAATMCAPRASAIARSIESASATCDGAGLRAQVEALVEEIAAVEAAVRATATP